MNYALTMSECTDYELDIKVATTLEDPSKLPVYGEREIAMLSPAGWWFWDGSEWLVAQHATKDANVANHLRDAMRDNFNLYVDVRGGQGLDGGRIKCRASGEKKGTHGLAETENRATAICFLNVMSGEAWSGFIRAQSNEPEPTP